MFFRVGILVGNDWRFWAFVTNVQCIYDLLHESHNLIKKIQVKKKNLMENLARFEEVISILLQIVCKII
jgi:hypothetical protein